MRIHEILSEAPLVDYEPLGDFEKPGAFRQPVDRKLVTHPVNIQKIYKFFEKTPYNFRIFPINTKGLTKFSESGTKTPEEIKQIFGKDAEKIINGHENAITIVYIGNAGAERVMLTPWMMAHRFGHTIQASTRQGQNAAWSKAESYFFKSINEILDMMYSKTARAPSYSTSQIKWDMSPEYNALFNAIGTQRSSRSNQIKRPYEFLYELFAQYLQSGDVTLGPMPVNLGYGRKAWGRPTKYMNVKPEYRDDTLMRQEESDRLAARLTSMFDSVLKSSVGNIYLM